MRGHANQGSDLKRSTFPGVYYDRFRMNPDLDSMMKVGARFRGNAEGRFPGSTSTCTASSSATKDAGRSSSKE